MKSKKALNTAKNSKAGQSVKDYGSDVKKGAIKGAILGGAAGGAKAAAKPLTNSRLGKAFKKKTKTLSTNQKLAIAGGAGYMAARDRNSK